MHKEQIKNNQKQYLPDLRTFTTQREIFAIVRIDGICLKKLQPDGCFEYDKVITVQRFSML
jgi:hypothetical protein